jgi:hypothetical protein
MRRTESSLEATNLQSLMRQLRSVGRYVGPRSGLNKRSKEDKELFCLRRYIATVAAKRQWDYPCAINMGEGPDFMIKFGNLNRGLEIRDATTEVFQRELTAFQREPNVNSQLDDGWVGDTPERAWCKAVLAAIADKVEKIKSYRQAQCHDILIYSNHPTDLVRGMNGKHPEYKQLQLQARQDALKWKSEPKLGIISVLDGRTLLYDLIGRCAQWKVIDMLPAHSFR